MTEIFIRIVLYKRTSTVYCSNKKTVGMNLLRAFFRLSFPCQLNFLSKRGKKFSDLSFRFWRRGKKVTMFLYTFFLAFFHVLLIGPENSYKTSPSLQIRSNIVTMEKMCWLFRKGQLLKKWAINLVHQSLSHRATLPFEMDEEWFISVFSAFSFSFHLKKKMIFLSFFSLDLFFTSFAPIQTHLSSFIFECERRIKTFLGLFLSRKEKDFSAQIQTNKHTHTRNHES